MTGALLPWDLGGLTFSVDGLAAVLGTALGAGASIGLLFVVLTLAYRGRRPR